ncbi:MAG: transporter [Candidatus Korobacteraceae bacterium]
MDNRVEGVRATPAIRLRVAWLTCAASLLAGVCVFCAVTVSAQVRGEYSPGSTLSTAGTVPDPGFSYSNQIWMNSSDRLYGDHGNIIPFQGQLGVLVDNNTVIYVPKFRLFHAKPEFMIDIAISDGRFDTRNPFDHDLVSVGAVGISNTNFVPLGLGWSLERIDLQAGLSVYAPTGRYVPGASNNLSSGFWTLGPQVGATFYLTSNKANQVSVYDFYGWNTVQEGTPVRPGQNESIDYSVTHNFSLAKGGKWSLLAGAAGYGQWQTTDSQGQRPARERLHYGVDGVGFTTNLSSPYKGLYVGFNFLFEYAARNTYEGRTTVITAGLSF